MVKMFLKHFRMVLVVILGFVKVIGQDFLVFIYALEPYYIVDRPTSKKRLIKEV